jgi:hypothetical protein
VPSIKDGNLLPIYAIMSFSGKTCHNMVFVDNDSFVISTQFSLILQNCLCTNVESVPWLRARRPAFDPRLVHVPFAVDRAAL